ncbi:hypothetical protein SELMODRAFT_413011 [Selaginella moellendorffii]|uniref:Uncharacterized protein n=1 Tax=Selaginella moellendorffii TaxID=88036 RepID=D8RN22_SELML|nr:hypothetical protein SELMODRAFT_413011 [Selaginella moellendorffii]
MPQENLQSYKRPRAGIRRTRWEEGIRGTRRTGTGPVEHVEGLLQQEEEQVEGLEGDQGLEAKGLESDGAEKKNSFKTSRAIKGWKLMEQRFMAQEGVLTLSKDTSRVSIDEAIHWKLAIVDLLRSPGITQQSGIVVYRA